MYMPDRFVSEIFERPTFVWGLRGDPFMWRYLQACFDTIMLPFPTEMFRERYTTYVQMLLGEMPEEGKKYHVPELGKIHVGMSTGHVSGKLWIEVALPMLLERLESLNAACGGEKI